MSDSGGPTAPTVYATERSGMSQDDQGDHARSVIDANRYMALGTADEAGNPWVSPVWFASEDYRTFHWVSSPDSKHSRNLAVHPDVAIAIFDSSVPVGAAQAVYMKGLAEELTGDELERGLEVFDRVSRKDIGREWGLDDVRGSALVRLYRATVSEHWVLIRGRDPERGSGVDRSERVSI
jgi:nitroimidazol reductase NimA-like FMN-containing flavoprotein (pyridoxamine 5'-phosphate oxidase superfamily)